MSDPIESRDEPIRGALCEIISGMSALNMAPEPRDHAPDEFYLSQVDAMAHHAMEHFQVACRMLNRAEQEKEKLQWEIHKLRCEIAKLKKK